VRPDAAPGYQAEVSMVTLWASSPRILRRQLPGILHAPSWFLAQIIFVIAFFQPASMAYNERYLSKLLSNRTLVEDGLSLNGTTLFELRYDESEHSVRCILNIENWTTWLLTDPLVRTHCGHISDLYPAPVVFPATREVMEGYKNYGTATGSCGTISWQIEGLKLRLIVMWSVPFNLGVHSSYLAVGMVYNEGRFSSSDYWFNQMYYGTHGPFKRAEGGQAITFENDKVVVHGFMESDSYSPLLNISVIPQVTYRLAPAIWKKMYNYDQHLYGGSGGVRLPAPSLSLLLLIVTLILATAAHGLPSPPQLLAPHPTWHHHLIARGQNWLQNVKPPRGFGWLLALLSIAPWSQGASLRTFRARTRAFAS